ncbi:hypothetical protein ACQ4PT_015063 [Festuca glaucescens]
MGSNQKPPTQACSAPCLPHLPPLYVFLPAAGRGVMWSSPSQPPPSLALDFGERNDWEQSLVLFSFALQVFLLSFAWIRRHSISVVPRLLLWLAYQLADSTALFTLGHLSFTSKLAEHQLVAFWAPFLLVHLGGQDTISAYSFEDNRLWLRHLQTLVVQVMGAAYVLYKYMPHGETLVIVAAVLIFVVGILKYGERIWALRSASFDNIWSSLDKSDDRESESESNRLRLLHEVLERRFWLDLDQEAVLMGAHGLLNVCKGLFIGLKTGRREYVREVLRSFQLYHRLDRLMEMELSLMYDILYTKATVIRTWYGCCIRIIALVAIVAAFVLFQFSDKHGHNRRDVAITYVLLVGALFLEMASLMRAVVSTWTLSLLYHKKWPWLYGELGNLRRYIKAARHRRWSGSLGQYNLLQSCAGDAVEPMTGIRMVRMLGLDQMAEYWWDELHHSHSVQLSDSTKELVLGKILEMGNGSSEIGSQPGLLTLKRLGLNELLYLYVGSSIQDIGFEDSVMAWHVATEICLSSDGSKKVDLREATRVLSNYMMFLLVLRPYMLPGPVRRSRYVRFRHDLYGVMQHAEGASAKDRVNWALHTGFHAATWSFDRPTNYDTGVKLADVLIRRPNKLEVIFGVWVEMLCYVANHCSRESHARQLSGGGELLTIVWLMARHANLS